MTTFTFNGTVVAPPNVSPPAGFDGSGFFIPGGGSLVGQHYSMTFTSTSDFCGNCVTDATLTINGHTFEFTPTQSSVDSNFNGISGPRIFASRDPSQIQLQFFPTSFINGTEVQGYFSINPHPYEAPCCAVGYLYGVPGPVVGEGVSALVAISLLIGYFLKNKCANCVETPSPLDGRV